MKSVGKLGAKRIRKNPAPAGQSVSLPHMDLDHPIKDRVIPPGRKQIQTVTPRQNPEVGEDEADHRAILEAEHDRTMSLKEFLKRAG